MSSQDGLSGFFLTRDWRIWFGIVITLAWLGFGTWYVAAAVRATPGGELSLEVIGSFLEGGFAPLAFLWLVIGLFIQQRELANNTEVLRQTSAQSEKQTQAIAATEMNARQETFFKIKENVSQQLGGISGMLYASSKGPAGDGTMSREKMDQNFKHVADGDCEVFARRFLSLGFLGEADLEDLFYGTDLRARHTRNYVRTFERLCRLAQNCDVDNIIEDALMQNAFGLLYRQMQDARPAVPDEEGGPPAC
jgi:hypothetical protein